MMIADNTTHFVTPKGMEDYGKTFKQRWIDLIAPKDNKQEEEQKEDDRPSEEIAEDIWARIRGH